MRGGGAGELGRAIGVYRTAERGDNQGMYYTCRRCGLEEPRGILPGTTCGLLLAVWGGVCAGILFGVTGKMFPGGLGWWWLLAAPAVVVVSLFPGSILLHFVAATFEWLVISVFPCKKCRSHRFSFGTTHGFGL